MDSNEINLSNSPIGGKFVGRDDNSLAINTTYNHSAYIQGLYDKIQKEKEKNSELRELCEELNYLNTQIQNETVIGLENKLIAGNQERLIEYAKGVKEGFHKKLIRTSQYSDIAQEINVYILTKVKRSFITEIHGMICNGDSQEKVNLMITERIINPVKADLGTNLFKYNEDDIMGMIYFLTGNCHIKWTS